VYNDCLFFGDEMKKSLEIGTELSQLGKDADSLCGLRQREYDADVFRGLK